MIPTGVGAIQFAAGRVRKRAQFRVCRKNGSSDLCFAGTRDSSCETVFIYTFKNKTLANREKSIYAILSFAITYNRMLIAELVPGLVGIRTSTSDVQDLAT